MKVTAIKHKDVKDKEQLYIKIENRDKKVIINVGQKTYDAIKEIEEISMVTDETIKSKNK